MCTRRGAKSVTCTRRGGSLQVSASAQEQLSPTSRSFSPQPILPRHHHQQIIGVFQTKNFPPSCLQTKSRHPHRMVRQVLQVNRFFQTCDNANLLPSWAHCFEIWPLHGNKTSRLRPVCKVLTSKYGRDKTKIWPSQWMQCSIGKFAKETLVSLSLSCNPGPHYEVIAWWDNKILAAHISQRDEWIFSTFPLNSSDGR